MTTTATTTPNKPYDLILFGVTGFTGKLAAEYLLSKYSSATSSTTTTASDDGTKNPSPAVVKWAVCARNPDKAQTVLDEIFESLRETKPPPSSVDDTAPPPSTAPAPQELPTVLKADLCNDEERLREVVSSTRVVITAAGPYKLFGTSLIRLCAELGVHYADITGETNFVRESIVQHDVTARNTGACLVCHCGNDCVPADLLVYELQSFAKKQWGPTAHLSRVTTYNQPSEEAAFSGGTVATALYNLGGGGGSSSGGGAGTSSSLESLAPPTPDGAADAGPVAAAPEQAVVPVFDPLLLRPDGTKSPCATKNITPPSTITVDGLGQASPWIMGPVMVNCVRRSNALLQYSNALEHADLLLESQDWGVWVRQRASRALLAAALYVPHLRTFLPSPGEGPTREAMEAGHLTVYAKADVDIDTVAAAADATALPASRHHKLEGTFRFGKDVSYLYTASLLVEAGLLLCERRSDEHQSGGGGVLTPAAAFGHALTERILERLEATLDIAVIQEHPSVEIYTTSNPDFPDVPRPQRRDDGHFSLSE